MNPLLTKLLPGLLPLIVFVMVDSFYGTEIGILVALAFGMAQLFYIRLRQKVWDRFVLFDTALLVALGLISLMLDSEKLFLWKPVLMDVVLIGFLLFSLLSGKNLVLLMSKRYLSDVQPDDTQKAMLEKQMRAFVLLTIIHAGLTIYAIYHLSHEAWAFIGGTLLYILLAAWLALVFIFRKFSKPRISMEYVPHVDEEGKIIERVSRDEVHRGTSILHPVVHLHVMRSDGAFLLQKRPQDKQIQPGRWDTAVGGHVAWGESIEKALRRETMEEIGLKQFQPLFAKKYVWTSELESELVFVFVYRSQQNDQFRHTAEVDELRWWSQKDIRSKLKKGVFTPNFEHEFNMLVKK